MPCRAEEKVSVHSIPLAPINAKCHLLLFETMKKRSMSSSIRVYVQLAVLLVRSETKAITGSCDL